MGTMTEDENAVLINFGAVYDIYFAGTPAEKEDMSLKFGKTGVPEEVRVSSVVLCNGSGVQPLARHLNFLRSAVLDCKKKATLTDNLKTYTGKRAALVLTDSMLQSLIGLQKEPGFDTMGVKLTVHDNVQTPAVYMWLNKRLVPSWKEPNKLANYIKHANQCLGKTQDPAVSSSRMSA